jgi:hypothetical protein
VPPLRTSLLNLAPGSTWQPSFLVFSLIKHEYVEALFFSLNFINIIVVVTRVQQVYIKNPSKCSSGTAAI